MLPFWKEHGGITIGQIGMYGVAQTVNGVQYKKWVAGIGFGYDTYYYKTIPVFIDIRRYLDERNKLLIYGDGGYNFSGKNMPGKEIGFYDRYNFKGGLYTDFGIGYKIKFIKASSFLFSLGHSYKHVQTKIGIMPACVGCQSYFYDYNYDLGRITIKAALML